MAKKKDVTFYRGEDIQMTVTMDPVEDISTWSLTFTARQNATDADPASITKSTGSGITITDGPGGTFTVAIADTDTTALTAGSYAYDIKRMDSGSEAILVTGILNIMQEVTR